jgi:hypothetical protein
MSDTSEIQEAAQPPVGKSNRELRAIVAADHARLDQVCEVWSELTEREQREVVKFARVLASYPSVPDHIEALKAIAHIDGPVPQSLKAQP